VLGSYRDMPRWMRRLFNGVAAHAEAKKKLPAGTLLDTPGEDLTPLQRRIWLEGTGLEEIRLAWKSGKAERGAKTKFEGILSMLGNRWRNAKSGILRRMLEKLMRITPCHGCQGARLSPQARAVRITTASKPARAAHGPELSLDRLCGRDACVGLDEGRHRHERGSDGLLALVAVAVDGGELVLERVVEDRVPLLPKEREELPRALEPAHHPLLTLADLDRRLPSRNGHDASSRACARREGDHAEAVGVDRRLANGRNDRAFEPIGALAILGDDACCSVSQTGTSPFAAGGDVDSDLGSVLGDQIGENFGFGGLGRSGIGEGGGGAGEATGLGSLGTIPSGRLIDAPRAPGRCARRHGR
jgi:hypothetical protein